MIQKDQEIAKNEWSEGQTKLMNDGEVDPVVMVLKGLDHLWKKEKRGRGKGKKGKRRFRLGEERRRKEENETSNVVVSINLISDEVPEQITCSPSGVS